MSGGKVKGILKGFRYFTQIFESEKEQDIQIGFPTDVKHVAHIGWDGPSVNSPSWMNEFKTSPTVDVHNNKGLENGVKRVAEESRRKNLRGSSDLPKPSKRQSTAVTDSPSREKTSKPRTRKTSHKNKDEIAHSPRIPEYPDPFQLPPPLPSPDNNNINNNNNNIPKKSRRHKTKDNSGGVPSKLRTKAHSPSDPGSPAQPKSRNTHTTFDDTEHDLLL